ncbi:MAG: glycosyltransferase family 2 protein [Hyphomonadaceae bacterium]
MTQRDVTVLITCYNEGAYVGGAVAAVLRQTASERIAEIILVDNASHDGSADVVAKLAAETPRAKAILIPKNRGPSGSRNAGLAEVKTPWVAFNDGDDYWADDKLERQLAAMARTGGETALYYGDFVQFTDDPAAGETIRTRALNGAGQDLLKRYFLFDGPIMPSTALVKMEASAAIGHFDEAIPLFEDTDYCMRLAGAGARFEHVGGVHTYKRVRAGSLSSQIHDWEGAMLKETRAVAARHPELAALAPRRNSFRMAKIADSHFAAGSDQTGWKALSAAWRANPLNPRVYLYGAIAIFPKGVRESIKLTLRRVRRAAMGRRAQAA